MMEMLNIKRGPRRPNRRRKEKAMKNITRTIRILNVEYPVKTENVKFLGEYDIIGTDENLFSMDIETFVRYAQTVR